MTRDEKPVQLVRVAPGVFVNPHLGRDLRRARRLARRINRRSS